MGPRVPGSILEVSNASSIPPSMCRIIVSGYYRDVKNTVVMYINFNDRAVDLNFTLSRSPHLRADRNYTVRDLWKHEDKPDIVLDYLFDAHIPPHDVRAYIFKEL